jgi:hypothetical protein
MRHAFGRCDNFRFLIRGGESYRERRQLFGRSPEAAPVESVLADGLPRCFAALRSNRFPFMVERSLRYDG